ncbi:hypothetical protein [Leptospira noguchii]|uniref:hypothetical protein n=1 Tax=Leptospira noguchii TaxID=28182 RepID=UPI001E6587F0|nr:hypothetical protein [Leptospira noguchii]
MLSSESDQSATGLLDSVDSIIILGTALCSRNILIYGRVGNSAERSLWIALETQQNALYGSRWKLSRTLSMDRVGNSAERSLWIALETQQNALYGSRSRSFENS